MNEASHHLWDDSSSFHPVHSLIRAVGPPDLHHPKGRGPKRHQEDQREIKRLQQELRRKEKALAEAAALLIASKKIQAYWGEDEGD